jgi:hypothetical protein
MTMDARKEINQERLVIRGKKTGEPDNTGMDG